ncbi:phage regulatory protein/antirepressor Ant [Xanthobacter sp. V3C-3]|uniref:phage antirepressor KilAC domain-containing protein n=1 Tax=Xanthobacter lutulentifluminis TaxID=3119935 RepID=UPI0037289EEA
MSSLEIAELTGKRHDNVMRDAKAMLTELHGVDRLLSFEGTVERPNPSGGASIRSKCYHLPKRETLILVSGYSVEMRARIIDRWMELETVVANHLDPMQVLNDPAAMRGLLLTYSEKVLALEARVEEQSVKVATLERIEGADGSMCLTDAAKTLKVRPIDLIRFMDSRRWIYKRPQNRSWIGYHDKIAGGLLEHDDHLYIDKEGRERVSTQVKVTGKGLVKLSALLNEKPH